MQPFNFLLVFFFLQQCLIAQQFNYTNFNTFQGFPSSEVYDMLEDRKGYMWFATNQGVKSFIKIINPLEWN
jgi:hypothetical protein